jgi:hypothetical protein
MFSEGSAQTANQARPAAAARSSGPPRSAFSRHATSASANAGSTSSAGKRISSTCGGVTLARTYDVATIATRAGLQP